MHRRPGRFIKGWQRTGSRRIATLQGKKAAPVVLLAMRSAVKFMVMTRGRQKMCPASVGACRWKWKFDVFVVTLHIVSRERAGIYSEGIQQGAPQAIRAAQTAAAPAASPAPYSQRQCTIRRLRGQRSPRRSRG